MKLLLTGDWHLRYKRPGSRMDKDYFSAQKKKVEQILKLAEDNGCSYILQPGDFFDSKDTPYFVIKEYLELLSTYDGHVFCVHGQHDLRYHSTNTENVPLAIMEAAGAVEVIRGLRSEDRIQFYGCGWGEEVPEIEYSDAFNILLMHRMVVDEKIWEGQEDYVYGKHLFRKYDYDLFVCGDNHKHFLFTDSNQGKTLVNCGSLMRNNVDQFGHVPVVYVFDTETRTAECVELKVRKADKVLNVKEAEKQKKRDEELDAFVEGLRTPKDLGLDFFENIRATLESTKIKQGVKNIVEEAMGNG